MFDDGWWRNVWPYLVFLGCVLVVCFIGDRAYRGKQDELTACEVREQIAEKALTGIQALCVEARSGERLLCVDRRGNRFLVDKPEEV